MWCSEAAFRLATSSLLAHRLCVARQVIGLKRLAPYRDDGGAARPNYGKLRELRAGGGGGASKDPAEPSGKLHRLPGRHPGRRTALVVTPPHHPERDAVDGLAHDTSKPAAPDTVAVGLSHDTAHVPVDQAQTVKAPQAGTSRPRKRHRKATAGAYGGGDPQSHLGPGQETESGAAAVRAAAPAGREAETSLAAAGPVAGNPKRKAKGEAPGVSTPAGNHAAMQGHADASQDVGGPPASSHSAAAKSTANLPRDLPTPSRHADVLQRRLQTYQQPAALSRGEGGASGKGTKRSKGRDKALPRAASPTRTVQAAQSKAQKRNARRARIRQEKVATP